MTDIVSEIPQLDDSIDDTNYFQILGKILMDSVDKKGLESQQIALLCKIPVDDIVRWLSPVANPNYAVLADITCQSITNGTSINKPSAENYLKLSTAGFGLEHLGILAVKLIKNEAEFLANEQLIFSKYLINPNVMLSSGIRNKIINSHGSDFSYEFITSYLGQKYPVVLDGIQWHKLAIKKAALDIIYQYKLPLSTHEINNINQHYCTFANIATAKEKSMSNLYPGLFNSSVIMDDFIKVNKITDQDHTRINYVKYLSVLKINSCDNRWAKISLVNDIYNYHPDLVRQFLDYILIPGPQLSQCNITLPEKINYIKQRTQTKEYTLDDIAKFINRIFYVNSYSDYQKPQHTFAEITNSLMEAGITMPLLELINLPDCYVQEYINWLEIRDVAKASNKVCMRIYYKYLRTLKSLDDWTPSIQMEYWNILSYSEYWFPQDRDKLVSALPVEILRDVPVKQMYSLRLYRHDGFYKLINNPDDKDHKLKRDFAKIINHELDELDKTGILRAQFSSEKFETNYKLKELGLIITQLYSEGLDILEYFQTGTRWLAEIVFESGTEYRNLSVDVLQVLITKTSNQQIIYAFRADIERKLKKQAEDDKIMEFAGLFQSDDDGAGEQTNLTQAVARLAHAVATRPIRYWSENDYKYACAKGFITPGILHEFKRTQPIPHPDFNWKHLTIILGTDQTILAYPELPWRTPIYSRRDGNRIIQNQNIDWEYFKDRTMLFSSDSEIWTKFSSKLPIDFILQRPNYKFQWYSVIARSDFNPTPEQWLDIKPKTKPKDLQSNSKKYNIELIMDNLDLGWDLQKLVSARVIPLKYLPKLFNPKWFNKSILDSSYSKEPEVIISAALTNLKRKTILTTMAAEPDALKYRFRVVNYVFGVRPHIEKIVLGFVTGFITS
jgi:hypothetical protein